MVLYFVREAREGKVLCRTAKTVKTAKTVMKATPLKLNPPFIRDPDFLGNEKCARTLFAQTF